MKNIIEGMRDTQRFTYVKRLIHLNRYEGQDKIELL